MSELAKISNFKREIVLAETWEDWKSLTIKGDLMADLAKKADVAIDGQNELGKTRIELEELKGKWLNKNHPSKGNEHSASTTMAEAEISFKESVKARTITNEPEIKEQVIKEIEEKNDIITPHKVASGIKKKKKEKEIEDQKKKIKSGEMSLPKGTYDIIVVDPPWRYNRKYDADTSRIASPYPEMSQDELKAIELGAAHDCVLWLWTTHKFIWDAKELLDYWGFEYKATFVWNKEKMGIGYWLRMQCEFCLLGIKGKPLWNVKDMRDILSDSRKEHSSKPDVFYDMIDEKFTSKRKADFFGRKEREGWEIK